VRRSWTLSSAVEHYLHTVGVAGSKPAASTIPSFDQRTLIGDALNKTEFDAGFAEERFCGQTVSIPQRPNASFSFFSGGWHSECTR
jgi:hypothetical protein